MHGGGGRPSAQRRTGRSCAGAAARRRGGGRELSTRESPAPTCDCCVRIPARGFALARAAAHDHVSETAFRSLARATLPAPARLAVASATCCINDGVSTPCLGGGGGGCRGGDGRHPTPFRRGRRPFLPRSISQQLTREESRALKTSAEKSRERRPHTAGGGGECYVL